LALKGLSLNRKYQKADFVVSVDSFGFTAEKCHFRLVLTEWFIMCGFLNGTIRLSAYTSSVKWYRVKVKVKVKFAIEQAKKAKRGSRGIFLLFL